MDEEQDMYNHMHCNGVLADAWLAMTSWFRLFSMLISVCAHVDMWYVALYDMFSTNVFKLKLHV